MAAAAVLIVSAVIRTSLWTYGADTGTFSIAIHNVPSGMYDSFEHASHFRFHWSPILATLYPLLSLTHSTLTLQIVQVLLVVGSVVAYYALVNRYLGNELALRCAIIAILYPPLLALAFSEFHELSFVPLLTFLALLALSARRWAWYALFAVALLCVREDVALITGIMACALAVYGIRSSDRAYTKAGAITALGATGVLLLYFGMIVPRLGGWGPSNFYRYTVDPSGSHFKDTFRIVPRLTYVLEALVPLAFLPMRTQWFWLVIPGLSIVLLANSGGVWRMGMHYVALWIPWALIAMAAAVAHIRHRAGEAVARRWLSAAVALCILFLIFLNPTHAGHYLKSAYPNVSAVPRLLNCVPADATLGTHDEWYTAIALKHPNETIGAPPHATYLLFADDYPNAEFQSTILPMLRREVAGRQLREVCRVDRVAVYRRIHS